MGSMTRWLDVEVGTDEIDLNTIPSNLALVDLQNDNEIKLLVGDFGRGEEVPKLKVFRGTMQLFDVVLPDLPLGVVGLYTNESSPRNPPIIAIAFGSSVYIYRNMKNIFQYYLPTPALNPVELSTWKELLDPGFDPIQMMQPLIEKLKAIPQDVLSVQSKGLLAMNNYQQMEYIEQFTTPPENKAPEVVCIATLKISSPDRYAASCLVVGSEDGEIVVLDAQIFKQLSQVKICAAKRTPYQMIPTGLYNVDYRITIATREKCVCVVKRDWPEGRILFSTSDHIIAIEVMPNDNSVVVICADNTHACYSKKGKKQWSIQLEHRPVSMTLLPIMHLGVMLTAVALASGHVHLYDNKARRDTLFVTDVASVMKFGQLGQEEHVFTIITASGSLMLKILKRTADFNAHAAGVESAVNNVQQKPWLIPKKPKLFLEQAVRERENAVVIHDTFQQELIRLRLLASKTLLEAHVKSDNSIGVGALEPFRLSAEVEGLGPVFRVSLIVENTSADKAVIGLSILFLLHATDYKVSNPYIKGKIASYRQMRQTHYILRVPLLSPGAKLKFPTKVEEVFTDGINPEVFFHAVSGRGGERALVKVLLLKSGQTRPVLAATVQMPPTDPMMLPVDKLEGTAFGEETF